MDSDSSAELLQHINAGASVRRVHHEVHRSIWFEDLTQSTESRIRVSKMVEDSGTHNLIKAHPQVAYALDGKLVDPKIFQIVFSLQFLRMAHTGCTAVDA